MEEYENILNKKELDYISDTDFLTTKHAVSDKITGMLKNVEDGIQKLIKDNGFEFPNKVLVKVGKISKGENYRLLPYLILDYPRYFHPDSVFAFRTMFWWGNFFSCTLHLQGSMLNTYRSSLLGEIHLLKNNNFFISIADSPWEYHYDRANYQLIESMNPLELQKLIKYKPFIKLSRYINVEDYNKLATFATDTFVLTMKSIRIYG